MASNLCSVDLPRISLFFSNCWKDGSDETHFQTDRNFPVPAIFLRFITSQSYETNKFSGKNCISLTRRESDPLRTKKFFWRRTLQIIYAQNKTQNSISLEKWARIPNWDSSRPWNVVWRTVEQKTNLYTIWYIMLLKGEMALSSVK